jgi:hypothetical protein
MFLEIPPQNIIVTTQPLRHLMIINFSKVLDNPQVSALVQYLLAIIDRKQHCIIKNISDAWLENPGNGCLISQI